MAVTVPLAHLIMFVEYWDDPDQSHWECSVCGRPWETLPDYANPERYTCPGKKP